jgi:hypothetical protein
VRSKTAMTTQWDRVSVSGKKQSKT